MTENLKTKVYSRLYSRSKGVTVIELLVAVAIGITLITIASSLIDNFRQSDKELDKLVELESIRNLIRSKTDCPTTLAGMVVGNPIVFRTKNNQPITALDANNRMLVGSGNKQWSFTATTWSATNGAFNLQATDPNGRTYILFRKVPMVCR